MTYEITVNSIDYEAEFEYGTDHGEVVFWELLNIYRDDKVVNDPVEKLAVMHELDLEGDKIYKACESHLSSRFDLVGEP